MKNNTYRSFLIADGNPTLIGWDVPREKRQGIIENSLGKVDQVGFAKNTKIPTLTMMGNELCINATLAFASTLSKKGILHTSGIEGDIFYRNAKETSIELDIPFTIYRNRVILTGIGYICTTSRQKPSKKTLRILAKKYNLPAFGELQYNGNAIIPYVYVMATDSLIPDSACGSGSIALNIYKNVEDIIQPTGKMISVKRTGTRFQVSAQVSESQFTNLRSEDII